MNTQGGPQIFWVLLQSIEMHCGIVGESTAWDAGTHSSLKFQLVPAFYPAS